MTFAALGCGDSNEDADAAVELSDAISLPATADDGSVLVYRAVRDGLLNSVGVDAVSGEELWAIVDSSFEPTLGRPTVLSDVLYAVDFDDESLTAAIRAVEVSTGQLNWSSPLGPHYASPYNCGADIVCLHAHPEAAPVSTWRFEKDSGDSSEGRAGGRTIYADEEVQISELSGATLGLSRDADDTMQWTAPIVEVFGPDHSTADGYWARRSADNLVVWLGKAGVLDGTFTIFGIDGPDPTATFSGVPCLLEAAEVDLICTRSGDELRLLDWDGDVIDQVSVQLPAGEVVPEHVYDASGRLMLLTDDSYRLGPDGFAASSTPDSGWCPADGLAVTETARSQPIEVAGGRFYYPCRLTDAEPLDVDRAARLAHQAAESPNADRLVTSTVDIVAFHAGPSAGLTVTPR